MFKKALRKLLNIFTSASFFNNAVSFVLVLMLMGTSFAVGTLYTQVKYLRGDLGSIAPAQANSAGNKAPTDPTANVPADVEKPSAKDHIKGNLGASVALIEYSDLDCPFCTRFHVTAQQALDFYKDKLMWVYRPFPLDMHPDAYKKAIAAECAFNLGGNTKFWDFSTILYERSESLADLPGIAKELGLDTNKFKTCFDGNQPDAAVKAGLASGSKAGVQGTPGNFIMNVKTGKVVTLRGAVPLADLKSAIDGLLQ